MDRAYVELYTAVILTHPVNQRWSNCITSIQRKDHVLEAECTLEMIQGGVTPGNEFP